MRARISAFERDPLFVRVANQMSLNMFFFVSGPRPSSYRPLTMDTPAEPPSRSSSLERSSWSRASILPCIDEEVCAGREGEDWVDDAVDGVSEEATVATVLEDDAVDACDVADGDAADGVSGVGDAANDEFWFAAADPIRSEEAKESDSVLFLPLNQLNRDDQLMLCADVEVDNVRKG